MTAGLAAPVLVLDPHGSGATQWHDCVPARRDFPRTVDDIDTLGLTPFDHVDDVNVDGWCFVRTPRPGQGRLTEQPTVGLLVVLISPVHDTRAQELRDWGDFVHISHIAAAGVPGYTMITPYENAGRGPRFLHLYEMDAPDAETTFQAMTPLVRQRLGRDEYRAWAVHPELQIDYVSTYRLADG